MITAKPEQLEALHERAAIYPRPEVHTLALWGPDRLRFLNGMLTQDLSRLAVHLGCAALKVNAKGKIEASVRVRAAEHALYLDVLGLRKQRLLEVLDAHIIMDDCRIEDATSNRAVLSVWGKAARTVLEAALSTQVPNLTPHGYTTLGELSVIADRSAGVLGYEIHGPPTRLEMLQAALLGSGAAWIDEGAFTVSRVEHGIPMDGPELDDDTLPMEAGLSEAVSLSKGCYVGQEVIARGTNLGGVQYALVGYLLGDAVLEPGTLLFGEDEGKAQGELCTVVASPRLGQNIALGYARKAHEKPGSTLWTARASGRLPAVVSALPFSG
ncbi:MAG: glycine cleavage T C-terminal barrel domain-containing protein [Myxococcota bacterium]